MWIHTLDSEVGGKKEPRLFYRSILPNSKQRRREKKDEWGKRSKKGRRQERKGCRDLDPLLFWNYDRQERGGK